MHERDRGRRPDFEAAHVTLADWLEAWLEDVIKRTRRPNTYRLYRESVRRHIAPMLGSKRLAAPCRADIDHWIRELERADLAPRTIHRLWAVLHSGLQHAVRAERLAVLGFSASEAADILETSPAAVNSVLQRARSGSRLTRHPAHVPLPRSRQEVAVVNQFVDAFERGDIGRLVVLLAEDARVLMPPESFEFRGRGASILDHLYQTHSVWGQGLKLVPTRANGQPAFGSYAPDRAASVYRAGGIAVLTLTGGHISEMTNLRDDQLVGSTPARVFRAARDNGRFLTPQPPRNPGPDEFEPRPVFHLSEAGHNQGTSFAEMRGLRGLKG